MGSNDSCKPYGNTTLACARIIKLTNATSSSPTVSVDTDFYLNHASLFYPAISMDDSNDTFFVASTSSSSIYPSVVLVAAPGGTTSFSGFVLQSGVAPMSCGCNANSTLIRFGDYSGIGVDGSNPSSIWVAGEYGNTTSTPNSTTWGTEIGNFNY